MTHIATLSLEAFLMITPLLGNFGKVSPLEHIWPCMAHIKA